MTSIDKIQKLQQDLLALTLALGKEKLDQSDYLPKIRECTRLLSLISYYLRFPDRD